MFIDVGFVLSPTKFLRMRVKQDSNYDDGGNEFEEIISSSPLERDSEDDDDDNNGCSTTHKIFRLTLGDRDINGSDYHQFNINYDRYSSLKKNKQKLVDLALQMFFGKDYLTDVYFERKYSNETVTTNNVIRDDNFVPVDCDIDEYFVGLLWNITTYQEGVCVDYGYNYGRSVSSTVNEIITYLKDTEQKISLFDRIKFFDLSFHR